MCHKKLVTKGRFTLGVKVMKSWGQLNQYLSSFEAQAGLKFVYSLVPRPFVGPPIHEGSFCALGAISRPTFNRLKYSINYWPLIPSPKLFGLDLSSQPIGSQDFPQPLASTPSVKVSLTTLMCASRLPHANLLTLHTILDICYCNNKIHVIYIFIIVRAVQIDKHINKFLWYDFDTR